MAAMAKAVGIFEKIGDAAKILYPGVCQI